MSWRHLHYDFYDNYDLMETRLKTSQTTTVEINNKYTCDKSEQPETQESQHLDEGTTKETSQATNVRVT